MVFFFFLSPSVTSALSPRSPLQSRPFISHAQALGAALVVALALPALRRVARGDRGAVTQVAFALLAHAGTTALAVDGVR